MKRTLLVAAAAGLMLAAVPAVGAPVCSWTGAWESNWGRMDLAQSGDNVSGSYVRQSGKMVGRVSGNVLSGKWSEAPTYKPPKDEGDYEFTMVTGCGAFDGRWRYVGESRWRPWTGKRGR
jgi:hypothetical protein